MQIYFIEYNNFLKGIQKDFDINIIIEYIIIIIIVIIMFCFFEIVYIIHTKFHPGNSGM